jgi:ADP-ribose pyrophosphatase YjhB (NUDIX family)
VLSLNLIVRAVIVHEGRLLTTVLSDGQRMPFHTLLGGHMALDETLIQCVQRELREEVGIDVAPARLLYIVENFFYRGGQKLHEIGYYFLCQPLGDFADGLLEAMTVTDAELISPELLTPEQFAACDFQPALLRDLIAADLKAGFKGCPKLVVINELPGDSGAKTGVFGLS